ncbi:MAG: TrbI/VirB10 family protein, partial [Burkholderiaceae bacterium]
ASAAVPSMQPGAAREDGIRPLRGADGKVIVNPQGRAMGVDKQGNVVEVPPILAMTNDSVAKKPLPGQPSAQAQGAGMAVQTPPPSRFGGSLFVGDIAKPKAGSGSATPAQAAPGSPEEQMQQIAELMRAAGLAAPGQTARPAALAPTGAPSATPFFGQPPGATLTNPGDAQQARPGTVASALFSSATPVALAKRLSDQNLILPKGRQADCILTGRIVDEVPGFTSCVLAQNLYSDNGRVLLLERGSELTGEYGITNQLGSERLFVTWQRVKTPEGVEVDLSSPGSDRLGTSGLPGHLDNRWGARIGAALLISFVKDITVALINNQNKSSTGTSVTVQSAPGQNTVNSSSSLAEEVIKQTIKTRPRLTINEGDRIAIYVARDLDFSPVYALKASGNAGTVKLLSR